MAGYSKWAVGAIAKTTVVNNSVYAQSASIAESSSYAGTASYALTASYAMNGGGGGTTTGSFTGSFTGSLLGTASYALTASYAMNGGGSVDTSSLVTTSSFNSFTSSIQGQVTSLTNATGSYVTNSQTSSFVTNSQTSSMTVLSASYSYTTDHLNPVLTTASTALYPVLIQDIGGNGIPYIDGGISYIPSTNQLSVTGITSSLFGSASYALSSSYASNGGTPVSTLVQSTPSNTWTFNHGLGITNPIVTIYDSTNSVIIPQEISSSDSNTLKIIFPENVTGTAVAAGGTYIGTTPTNAISASYVLSASYAVTASYSPNYVLNSATSSFITTSQTSSFVTNSQTSSFITTSQTSSFVLNSQTSSFVTNSQTSSFVINSQTSSFVTTGSNTFTGNQILSSSLIFAPPTSPSFNGEIVQFGAGTLTTGQLYFLSSSGTWSLANANSTSSSIGMLGIAIGSSPTSNGLLIRGYAASSSYSYGTGAVIYMATSSGIMTNTSPSSSNHVVRVMGYQTTLANTIYFDPDKTWVTLA